MTFGGRQAWGWGNGNGHNGAGYTTAYLEDDSFKIIDGGGGGNSESGNKRGEAGKDGEGKYSGKGATKDSPDEGGDPNKNDSELNEGKGRESGKFNNFCGVGGGNVKYGGEQDILETKMNMGEEADQIFVNGINVKINE